MLPKVLRDHCAELLSMKSPTDDSTILEPEKEASSLITKSFWDVTVPFGSDIQPLEKKSRMEGKEESSSKSSKPGNINVVAAGLILFLSVIIGFVLFLFKG